MPPDPQEKETLYLLDKKTVAKAQLQTAIILWLNEGDPASILMLAVAANDCYNSLGGHVGKPSVFQTWLKGQPKPYQKRVRRAQNFVKHGNIDLTGSVPYSPVLAEMLILDSIECHENINGQVTSLMQIFDLRLALEMPRLLKKTGTAASLISANAGVVEHLRRKDRHVFYKDFRNELKQLGLWTL